MSNILLCIVSENLLYTTHSRMLLLQKGKLVNTKQGINTVSNERCTSNRLFLGVGLLQTVSAAVLNPLKTTTRPSEMTDTRSLRFLNKFLSPDPDHPRAGSRNGYNTCVKKSSNSEQVLRNFHCLRFVHFLCCQALHVYISVVTFTLLQHTTYFSEPSSPL